MMNYVDEFIIFDDMQYTKRDWRNRNKIKTSHGAIWLSIPVLVKGKFLQKIRETEIMSDNWAAQHWKAIELNYKKASHFDEIASLLKPLYFKNYRTITDVNVSFIKAINDYLGITTKISFSWDYFLENEKSERLASLVEQCNGTHYISGPAAKNYLDPEPFANKNLSIEWFSYEGYKDYKQLWGEFNGAVSIIDLLLNHGKESINFILKKDLFADA